MINVIIPIIVSRTVNNPILGKELRAEPLDIIVHPLSAFPANTNNHITATTNLMKKYLLIHNVNFRISFKYSKFLKISLKNFEI